MKHLSYITIIILVSVFNNINGKPRRLVSVAEDQNWNFTNDLTKERDPHYWINQAQVTLEERLNTRYNTNKAKNVILFLGDGMSIPTITAARIYAGQKQGYSGEEFKLFFEKFPFTGLAKTYCTDNQVADSACSSTAYLSGVKACEGTLGVDGNVPWMDCVAMQNQSYHVHSILQWAQDAGKATGVVTTTRITHATPGGTYSHTANRDWESDYDAQQDGIDVEKCPDIAAQILTSSTSMGLNVFMGGGRVKMLPKEELDETGQPGERLDERNLIKEWQQQQGANSQYVWNRTELIKAAQNESIEHLLGVFESGHCQYYLDADPTIQPTLSDMVESAITMLSRKQNGYFLFVEGGRIDTGHHDNTAHKALEEALQMDLAVQLAVNMTSEDDTLIVVTADHAHTLSMTGYPYRGTNILGPGNDTANDGMQMFTLSYANGPGYEGVDSTGQRPNPAEFNYNDKDFVFPALVNLTQETHGGDDVAVFALGPWAHLFTGLYEQNVLPHIMGFASCIGNGLTLCNKK